MKEQTDISIILDRSGSMYSIANDTIGGVNSFLESQRKIPGSVVVSLHQFDNQYQTDYSDLPLHDVPNLTPVTYSPRGSTALLDAIGRTINSLGQKLASKPEHDRPNRVLVVIMTDGYENASHEFNQDQIRDMIKHQEDKYDWEFVFLGANQDAITTASFLGIKGGSSLSYAATGFGVNSAFNSLSDKVGKYRSFNSAQRASIKSGDMTMFDNEDVKTQVEAGVNYKDNTKK